MAFRGRSNWGRSANGLLGVLAALVLCTMPGVLASGVDLERELVTAPPVMSFVTAERLLKVHVVSDEELKTTIDRRAFLRRLVARITAEATTDQQRVEMWTEWLQNHMLHSTQAPLDSNGQAIYDPLWLLKNRVGHCGQTNRLLVDGLDAAGYKTRLVQFVGHVGAEVYFEGGWRYVDADVFDFGTFIRRKDGSLASGEDITADPSLLDMIDPLEEARRYPPVSHPPLDPPAARALLKYQFTHRETIGGFVTPFVWVKTATRDQEKNIYYGWNYYRAERGW